MNSKKGPRVDVRGLGHPIGPVEEDRWSLTPYFLINKERVGTPGYCFLVNNFFCLFK